MKNFEEQMVLWTDDALPPDEAAAFEAQLPDINAARQQKSVWTNLRAGLKEVSVPPPEFARDAGFLKSQVSRSVRAESCDAESGAHRDTALPSIWRLVWGGCGLCALALVMAVIVISYNDGVPSETQFISQVIEARSANPERNSASSFRAPDGKGSVIWLENPGFIPAQQAIR